VEWARKADLGLISGRAIEPTPEGNEASDTEGSIARMARRLVRQTLLINRIEFRHQSSTDSDGVAMDYMDESDGTRRYLELVARILDSCDEGGVICIDEFDAHLHPALQRWLIEHLASMPCDQSTQFIFSTHNPLLLDKTLFRRDQVYFIAKHARNGNSRLSSLTDYKPRKDEALLRNFMTGRYSGTPSLSDWGLPASLGKTGKEKGKCEPIQ
jgi:AAA15 family ATPase/GTPase